MTTLVNGLMPNFFIEAYDYFMLKENRSSNNSRLEKIGVDPVNIKNAVKKAFGTYLEYQLQKLEPIDVSHLNTGNVPDTGHGTRRKYEKEEDSGDDNEEEQIKRLKQKIKRKVRIM